MGRFESFEGKILKPKLASQWMVATNYLVYDAGLVKLPISSLIDHASVKPPEIQWDVSANRDTNGVGRLFESFIGEYGFRNVKLVLRQRFDGLSGGVLAEAQFVERFNPPSESGVESKDGAYSVSGRVAVIPQLEVEISDKPWWFPITANYGLYGYSGEGER